MDTNHSTNYALLGSMMSGPRHGYEILRFLNTALGSTWRVGTSQLYALLNRMERDGLLMSTIEPQATRPSRRVFSLTQSGRQRFLAWLRSPSRHVRDLRTEFLTKLFFLDRLGLAGGEELVRAQITILEDMRSRIRRNLGTRGTTFKELMYGFKLTTLEAWLGWLRTGADPFVRGIRPGADPRKHPGTGTPVTRPGTGHRHETDEGIYQEDTT